jgi:hypothetical protein
VYQAIILETMSDLSVRIIRAGRVIRFASENMYAVLAKMSDELARQERGGRANDQDGTC